MGQSRQPLLQRPMVWWPEARPGQAECKGPERHSGSPGAQVRPPELHQAQAGDSPATRSPPPRSPRGLKMEDFFPETYRLDVRDERQAFFTLFDGERLQTARSRGTAACGGQCMSRGHGGVWSGQGWRGEARCWRRWGGPGGPGGRGPAEAWASAASHHGQARGQVRLKVRSWGSRGQVLGGD